eukprot:CAMPEP_0174852226 /NCGR_PEP_ID=MMETSP1114-20130205/25252_1 /TAXON_ID=312471 /ORGANISM="Neobodo designis, Strain CCAP 1951/1" /LENGTH=233 /DNA_ID=CAMNT_0016086807 /DNA_START=107 /DNA_END=808 /DNA_ORIENTATION=-
MAIPIPSAERSLPQKRYRGVPRSVSTEPAMPYLHRDHQEREHQQHVFESSPTNMVTRGLSSIPPETSGCKTTLRYIPAPEKHPHPEGRRNPHRVPPIPAERQQSLYPPGGMTVRPERARAATSMEQRTDGHVIFSHVTPQGSSHPGKRIFPHANERSVKGDMSLIHGGVKRIDHQVKNPDANAIPGFNGMGRFSGVEELKMGKRAVAPEPYDPIRYFEMYGRRHPPPRQQCQR